jgi:predicted transcriptional regulator
MARPPAKELTDRELELMHVFWEHGPLTAAAVREHLADGGRDLAYTTVATLVRILVDKGFLKQTSSERPFVYQPTKTFGEVSKRLVSDLVERVFGGSRTQLLVQLMEEENMSPETRALLEDLLRDHSS